MKAGVKTSEFWVVIITVIIQAIATHGFIGQSDVQPLVEAVVSLIGGLVTVIIAARVVIEYIRSRTVLKQQQLKETTPNA